MVSAVFAVILILAPFVHMTKERAARLYCANDLRQISLGLHRYALDHNKAFPGSLSELYPNYVSDRTVLDNFSYAPGLAVSSPPGMIIVQERDEDHKKAGKNILRVDGSVEWVKRAR